MMNTNRTIRSTALGALAIRGLDFGIEFEGGADFRAATTVNSQTVDDMRELVDPPGRASGDEHRLEAGLVQ